MFSSGGAGAVDRERWPDPGEQRPNLPAAEDSFWTDSLLLHPADLPLHLREQKDGHHRQGVELVYNNMMSGCSFLCGVLLAESCVSVFLRPKQCLIEPDFYIVVLLVSNPLLCVVSFKLHRT